MTTLIRSQVADNIELIYLKEQDIAGIHMRGLAAMLGCNQSAISFACQGVQPDLIFETEIPTAGGLQGVKFILEKGVMQVLKVIRRGNYKQETKDAAEDLYDRFAEAGFKLYVMFKAAPEELVAKFAPPLPAPTIPQPSPQDIINEQIEAALKLAGKPGEGAIKAYVMLYHTPVDNTPYVKQTREDKIVAKILQKSRTAGGCGIPVAVTAREVYLSSSPDKRKGIGVVKIRKVFKAMADQGLGTVQGSGIDITFTATTTRDEDA